MSYTDLPDLPLVYVAGPMTKPDMLTTARRAVQLYDKMMRDDVVLPFCPHLSILHPLIVGGNASDHEFWLRHDFQVIRHAEAVYRMDGESTGSDLEVRFALDGRAGRGAIPVFFENGGDGLEDLYAWAQCWTAGRAEARA